MVKRLFDMFGRLLRPATRAELLEDQSGPRMGTVRTFESGHPATGLTPPRLAAILRAAEMGDATAYLEMAEEMEEKDLHYSAVLGVRKRAVRALDLIVEPGDDTRAATEAADLVRSTLQGPAIRESLIDVMDAVGKGFSVSEIVWDMTGKSWRIEGLEFRNPAWFQFDTENGQHLRLRGAGLGERLNPDNYLIHVSRAKSGLPIRGGLARLAAYAFMFKNFGVKDWQIFLEAYGHPVRLGKFDPALASEDDKRTLMRAARNIGVDMAAIIPHNMDLDIVRTDTRTTDAYERQARWWDEQISKGVLGQVATTDAIAGGHAVGKIHEAVREDIRDADADQLAISLMRDIARPLVRHNLGLAVPVPMIRFEAPESVDLDRILRLMEVAGPAGLRLAMRDIYPLFSLRQPEEGEEVLNFGHLAPPPQADLARQTASRQPHDDAIAALIDELLSSGRMQAAATADFAPLIETLSGANSYEEALDLIGMLVPDAGLSNLRDLLAEATFSARLAGQTGPQS